MPRRQDDDRETELMYNPRKYRCLRCWRKFALADGIVCQPSVGAVCPHCGSRLTVSRWH